jgi:hypothetical protein
MEDPENTIVFSQTESFEKKTSFEIEVTPAWTPSASNPTRSRFLSEKLSAWGVEARGEHRILTLETDQT